MQTHRNAIKAPLTGNRSVQAHAKTKKATTNHSLDWLIRHDQPPELHRFAPSRAARVNLFKLANHIHEVNQHLRARHHPGSVIVAAQGGPMRAYLHKCRPFCPADSLEHIVAYKPTREHIDVKVAVHEMRCHIECCSHIARQTTAAPPWGCASGKSAGQSILTL